VGKGGKLSYGVAAFAAEMAAATPADPLYIVEIAPATSLGTILGFNPGLAANCIPVAMSGSIYRGCVILLQVSYYCTEYSSRTVSRYENSSTPAAEYNVVQNITASQFVYNSSWLSEVS
jgi:hypothetical protein